MHIHKVGEVLGAAKVPSRDSLSTWLKRLIVSRTWVGQIVIDQHTKGRLKLLVLFNLGLAHMAATLLLHLPIVQAKESCPLLKTGRGRQRSVPNLPASRQLSSLLQKEIKRDSGLKTSPIMGLWLSPTPLAAASPSPWGSLPHTWIEMLRDVQRVLNQIEETHLG